MRETTALSVALALGLYGSTASAQQTTITTNPDGTLSGSVSAGDAPAISINTGAGQVSSSASVGVANQAHGPRTMATHSGPGCTVTVRSPTGNSFSTVTVTGSGHAAVAGAGSPGSHVTSTPCQRDTAAKAKPKKRRAPSTSAARRTIR